MLGFSAASARLSAVPKRGGGPSLTPNNLFFKDLCKENIIGLRRKVL